MAAVNFPGPTQNIRILLPQSPLAKQSAEVELFEFLKPSSDLCAELAKVDAEKRKARLCEVIGRALDEKKLSATVENVFLFHPTVDQEQLIQRIAVKLIGHAAQSAAPTPPLSPKRMLLEIQNLIRHR